MTTAMMLPVLPLLDALGFEAIEYTSAAAMEVCIRHLKPAAASHAWTHFRSWLGPRSCASPFDLKARR